MNCPHCNVHIDEHPASRCLAAWVATDVMGWTNCDPHEQSEPWEFHDEPPRIRVGIGAPPDSKPGYQLRGVIPDYPNDIAAAWEVVEKLAKRGIVGYADSLLGWNARKASHTICRAAIKARPLSWDQSVDMEEGDTSGLDT